MNNSGINSNNAQQLDCLTCDMVVTYQDLAGGYVETISATMLPPMSVLFASVCTLWVVIQGYKFLLGTAQLPDLLRETFFICIAQILLSVQSEGLILMVFNTTLDLLGGASYAVLEGAIQDTLAAQQSTGLGQLVAVSEAGMRTVINVGWEIATSWSFTNMLAILYALILILPYFMMMIVYLSQTVIAVFRVMVISAFFPFLILCFGFAWSRQMAFAGLKTLMASIIVLFAASLALGVVMFAVSSLEITAPDADVEAKIGWNNADYLLAVALGWMGTAFMTEAVGIANSITGSALSNTSVGILSAGMAGSAALAAKMAKNSPAGMMNVAGYGAAAIGGGKAGVQEAIANRAASLIDKYKSGYRGTA